MNKAKVEKWTAAAKILGVDPSQIVRCPERDDGVLVVHDVVFERDPTMMERWLICDTCHAGNAMRMPTPPKR